jgi:hypothetical protein
MSKQRKDLKTCSRRNDALNACLQMGLSRNEMKPPPREVGAAESEMECRADSGLESGSMTWGRDMRRSCLVSGFPSETTSGGGKSRALRDTSRENG